MNTHFMYLAKTIIKRYLSMKRDAFRLNDLFMYVLIKQSIIT